MATRVRVDLVNGLPLRFLYLPPAPAVRPSPWILGEKALYFRVFRKWASGGRPSVAPTDVDFPPGLPPKSKMDIWRELSIWNLLEGRCGMIINGDARKFHWWIVAYR